MPTPITPTCSKCGYHLTGLGVDDVCPECGTTIWRQEGVQSISGFAITSLVMGCLAITWLVMEGIFFYTVSLFGIGAVITLGLTGVIFGHLSNAQVRRGTRSGATKGIAIAGLILSYFGISLRILSLLALLVGLVIGFRF